MPTTFSSFSPPLRTITRFKEFKDANITTAITAANTFVSGTLETDPDNTYSSRIAGSYWDGGANVIILEYSYTVLQDPAP